MTPHGPGRMLRTLHSLLIMDDTLLLVIIGKAVSNKFQLLVDSTVSLDMELHTVKLKYVGINTADQDQFLYGNVTVERTDEYLERIQNSIHC